MFEVPKRIYMKQVEPKLGEWERWESYDNRWGSFWVRVNRKLLGYPFKGYRSISEVRIAEVRIEY